MPSILVCTIAFVICSAGFFMLGMPFVNTERDPSRYTSILHAPVVGFGLFAATSTLVQILTGNSSISVFLALSIIISISYNFYSFDATRIRIQLKHYAPPITASLVLVLITSLCLTLKTSGDLIGYADPILDHGKIAIINSIIREGTPPINPFTTGEGQAGQMRYYYLWYSTAAIIAQAGGLSAWEGDIVMTAFTAFSSLLCMMGFAARLSDDRIQARRAAYWILALSLAGSAFPALYVVFGHEAVRSLFAREHGLETWIFQASWVPQHLASGSAVLIGLALLFEARPASKLSFRRSLPAGLMIAAGFGMSTWVGGLTFAICATSILVYKAASTGAGDHHRLAWQWGSAAAVAIVFASPFIYNQLPFLDLRGGHTAVVGLHPYPVLADTHVSDPLNLAAFWLLLLPAYMPALFIPSVICQWRYFSSRPVAGQSVLFLSILMYSSLAVSWLLRSQLANNDLGWRAVIIAVLAMTVLAALELSRNNASPAKYVCVGLLAIALLDGSRFALMNAKGNGKWMKDPIPDSAWQSIQRHTTTKDRILSNPHGYSAIESFGVNVMWTLKSNRNSCFQSADFVRAYQRTWSFDEIRAIDAELQLFFDGKIAASKISPLLSKLECTKVLIVEADRIWQSKQLLKSANLEPVSSGAGWKLLAPSTPSAGSIAD